MDVQPSYFLLLCFPSLIARPLPTNSMTRGLSSDMIPSPGSPMNSESPAPSQIHVGYSIGSFLRYSTGSARTSGHGFFRSLKPPTIDFLLQVHWIDRGHWTRRSVARGRHFRSADALRRQATPGTAL
jgi:hypothetical protein